MSNVVTLHADRRWKAVIEYGTDDGLEVAEHYFEEILDLHLIIEHGPDWNRLIRCTVTLNRQDDGEDQNSTQKSLARKSSGRKSVGVSPRNHALQGNNSRARTSQPPLHEQHRLSEARSGQYV